MRFDRHELIAIFAGGVIGTLARAGLVELWVHDPGRWPWATFVVNVIGAGFLGWLAIHPLERPPRSPYDYGGALLGTGVCGALTTFSGLQLELLVMLDAGARRAGAGLRRRQRRRRADRGRRRRAGSRP